MDTDFFFGSLQFGTELHVKYYLRKWRPLTSSMVDEIQNLLVPAGILSYVKHNSCLFSVSETDREPHTYFGTFSQCALTFCFGLGDAFLFRECGRLTAQVHYCFDW
jgi:hypothetical protein